VVPYVETEQQARDAVSAMRYPPHGGIRGVAKTTRATNFGRDFVEYWDHCLERLVLVAQIETRAGVEACEAIAKVDGVDVLYVGPTDLSVSLGGGAPLPFDDARLVEARGRVAAACRAAGKAAGILCLAPEHVPVVRAEGYTFMTLGSDVGVAATGIRACAAALRA
jgi:4-hydroxy-2-oxoheptanedioate aldolase